tara:strand:+ start:42637 stop:43083 length:447 start_codon:yes stop_codon:yes gene_type:complete
MARWRDGAMAWLDGLMARWLDGAMARWLDGSMARWLDGSMARWLDGSVRGLAFAVRGSRFGVRGSGFAVWRSRFAVRGLAFAGFGDVMRRPGLAVGSLFQLRSVLADVMLARARLRLAFAIWWRRLCNLAEPRTQPWPAADVGRRLCR